MGFLSSFRSLFAGPPPLKSAIPEKFALRVTPEAQSLRNPPLQLGGSLWTKEEAWLDKALNPFFTRLYDAAIPHSYTADWQGYATSGSYEVLNAWRQVCYLARDLGRNNSHAIAFLRELKNNVLGSTGIRLQSRVMLQKGGRLNKPLNLEIKNAWADFRRKGNYEVTGQWSGQTLDEMILERLATDGGALLRLHRGYPRNKYRFAVQALEVDALDLWYNTVYSGTGNRVTMGVETDAYGKPVAYWLLDYYQSDLMSNNATGTRVRVPAEDIIHLWLPHRITSVREVSWFAPAMIDLRMLGKYEEAAVISARNAAAKMGFYERDKDAPRYEGQGQLKDGTIVEEINPGILAELPAGVTFKPFNPGVPNDTYPEFRKNMLRSICSGLGAMYNSIGNDLESVNYSSARFGKDVENETWKGLQRFLSEHLFQEVFNPWLECAVLAGTLQMSFSSQIENVQKSIVWRPRGYSYVDPTKETQSALAAIDGGLSTYRKELADLGVDFDEFLDEVEAERDELKRRGIVFVNAYSRRPEVESSMEDPSITPGHNPEAEGEGVAAGNGKSRPAGKRS